MISKKRENFQVEKRLRKFEYHSIFDFYYTFQDLFLEIFASTFQLIKSKKPIKESIYDHKTLHPLSKEMMKDIRSKGERYFFEEKMMERNESSNILFNFRFLSCISGFISGNISIYHFLSIIFLSIISLIKSKKSIKESIYDHKTLHPLSTILCNLGGQ